MAAISSRRPRRGMSDAIQHRARRVARVAAETALRAAGLRAEPRAFDAGQGHARIDAVHVRGPALDAHHPTDTAGPPPRGEQPRRSGVHAGEQSRVSLSSAERRLAWSTVSKHINSGNQSTPVPPQAPALVARSRHHTLAVVNERQFASACVNYPGPDIGGQRESPGHQMMSLGLLFPPLSNFFAFFALCSMAAAQWSRSKGSWARSTFGRQSSMLKSFGHSLRGG